MLIKIAIFLCSVSLIFPRYFFDIPFFPSDFCAIILLIFLIPRKIKPADVSIIWMITAFLLLCFISLTYVDGLNPEGDNLRRFLRYVAVFSVAYIVLTARDVELLTEKHLFRTVVAFGGVAIGIGALGFGLQIEGLVATQSYWYPGFGLMFRAGGVFENSGPYGAMAVLLLAISLVELGKGEDQAWSIFGVLAGAIGIGLSASRTGIFVLVMFLFAAMLVSPKRSFYVRITLILFGIAALVTLTFPKLLDYFYERYWLELGRYFFEGGQLDTFTRRGLSWEATLQRFLNQDMFTILFGEGINSLGRGDLFNIAMQSADNQYLSVLVENGLIGWSIVTGLIVTIFWRLISNIESRDTGLVWFAICVCGMFGDIFSYPAVFSIALIYVLSALKWANIRNNNKNVNHSTSYA
ncbi:O-antigen ligase family protein [Thalassospira lucentensis]|uniref:O-antigen ligase family protein n=1 Tax=Thalassospira lucentensis TaxID=168935 RepID=UPI002942570E|nr:O-antigen ligase family protein [Thalassospira lucentensis]WOI11252.1 O-antigen ligase family protein [Thalassospira lucentensis]